MSSPDNINQSTDGLGLFCNRNFTLLWMGQWVSILGDMMLYTALPFYIYETTRSSLATGFMFLLETLPGLVLSPFAGVWVDRWDRRKTMIWMDLGRGVLLLLLMTVKLTGAFWLFYLFGFLHSCMSVFFSPSKNALLPQMVGKDNIMKANSIIETTMGVCLLVGPPLGGFLLKIMGIYYVFLLDAFTYVFSALMIWLMVCKGDIKNENGEKESNFWNELATGFNLIINTPHMMTLFLSYWVISMGHGILGVVFIMFVKDTLQASALEMGWITTGQGVGGLMGGFILARMKKELNPAVLLVLNPIISGISLFLMGMFPSLSLVIGLATVVGLFFVGWSVAGRTLIQRAIDNAHLGKVFSLLSSGMSLAVMIGLGLSGLLGKNWSPVLLIYLSAGIHLLGAVPSLFLLRGPSFSPHQKEEALPVE